MGISTWTATVEGCELGAGGEETLAACERVLLSIVSTMPQASEHRVSRAREQVITSQPKATAKLLNGHRAVSQERHASVSPALANGLSMAPKLRPLPPRPSPLDDRGKKQELERGRASKRSDQLRGSVPRRGPVKADHAVKVPKSPQPGTMSGSASFSMPSGVLLVERDSERRRNNLARSKSISIGDLSQAGGEGEELSMVLSRLVLRDRSPPCSQKLGLGPLALQRSSSLRRVSVSPGLDGRPAGALLSVRTESCTRTHTPDPQVSEYLHPQDVPAAGSPPQGKVPSPAPSRPDKKTHHTLLLGSGHIGLRNLGNTCFMNAVLQCLSSTKPLRDYCLRKEFLQEQPSTSRAQQELTEAFADVISSLWHPDSTEAVDPGRFKAVFQKYVPSFTGYSQQDAQEFLKFFMDRLHVEINRKGRKTPSILSDTKWPLVLEDSDPLSDDERANQMWKRYLEREDSKIVDLFVGQLKSCLKCQACGYRSTTFEVFCDLSLPIPKKGFAGGKVSLLDCFSLFTKEEELDSENAPGARCITSTPCAITRAACTMVTTPPSAGTSPAGGSTTIPACPRSARTRCHLVRATCSSMSWTTIMGRNNEVLDPGTCATTLLPQRLSPALGDPQPLTGLEAVWGMSSPPAHRCLGEDGTCRPTGQGQGACLAHRWVHGGGAWHGPHPCYSDTAWGLCSHSEAVNKPQSHPPGRNFF
nr:ubiquitin carboxyl-terminal hydrolase 21 isoform X2 [Caretta caretta]XP_048683699.1 ubiquitin carboxyl-terminal hydrolase 21 isoform X2 [Caretta caretta]